MFDFLRKKPAAAPVQHIAVPVRSPLNVKRETGGRFRQGMWVRLQESTGILTALNELGVATVMLVDEHGLNLLETHAPIGDLRRAKISQIPAKRVAHLDKLVLKRFGYED